MDKVQALEELRSELKQILDNYYQSKSQVKGIMQRQADSIQYGFAHLEVYAEYAIMIYGAALRHVEYLIRQSQSK